MAKKIVKKTAKAKASTGHTTHPYVMSFRLTSSQTKTMEEIIKNEPPTHVKSANQLGRKIVVDYLAGRLEYRNPADKLKELEPVGR